MNNSNELRQAFAKANDLFRQKRYTEAIASYLALETKLNGYWKYWLNRAGVSRRLDGGESDAHRSIARAVKLAPDRLEVAVLALAIQLEFDPTSKVDGLKVQAIHQHHRDIAEKIISGATLSESQGMLIDSVFEFSLALLKREHLNVGWQLYEWRLLKPPFHQALRLTRATSVNQSRGNWVVFAEQGIGDCIQFSRFLIPLQEISNRLALVAPQPLLSLLRVSLPSAIDVRSLDVFTRGSAVQESETKKEELRTLLSTSAAIPLMSLPNMLHLSSTELLSRDICLKPPGDSRCKQFDGGERKFKNIGIAWQGNPAFLNDETRSIPAHEMLNIMNSLGSHRYHLIQPNLRDEDVALLSRGHQIINHQSEIRDFLDTANIMASLDMVITVDTSVAHLSASLGKRTYIIINHPSDWRWGDSGERSYWYSTATLVRSYRQFDWTRLLHEPT